MIDSLLQLFDIIGLFCSLKEKKLLFCLFVKKNGLPLQPLH